MQKMRTKDKKLWLFGCLTVLLLAACNKYIPKDRDTITSDTRFTQMEYQPVLGRTTLFDQNFYGGNSTIPFTFKIINPRLYADGSPAGELLDTFPVKIWKKAYTGDEVSLDEIESKRVTEFRPLFEIGAHSGSFTMWSEAKTPFVRSLPDSGYIFDVEASNSGGRVYYRDFRLMPLRERPFEPSNQDPYTGQTTTANINPSLVYNIIGEKSGYPIGANAINVYFHKIGAGNSLTFRFVDTLFNPINPNKFGDTDWKNLVHGFDMLMTPESVSYKVAYPIPLVALPTKYTTQDGQSAHLAFKYHRLGFGGLRQDANMELNFNIYEQGDWEIVFWFRYENPRFDNE